MASYGIRRATEADIPAMAENVRLGVGSFKAWAPSGWTPPFGIGGRAELRAWWASPGFIAFVNADCHAHVAARAAEDEPGAVHLLNLFARSEHQGTGVAAALLERVVEDARATGARAMRLRTPEGNARGIRFYEREGWVVVGGPIDSPIGLPHVWMRRAL